MSNSAYKTPQLHIVGKLAYAQGFDYHEIYAKFSFKAGANWTLLSGSSHSETFQSIVNDDSVAPFEHPIDLNYATKSIRGWPKIALEIWVVDSHQKSSIGGYGVVTVPIQGGHHKLKVDCWRPMSSGSDKLLGTYPELEFKDVLVSSQSRYGLTSETTGTAVFEIDVIVKDFQLHGVIMND